MTTLNDAEISMTQPLARSVRFKLYGRWYVQLGNPGRGEVCLMPAETEQDFTLIEHLQQAWELNRNPYPARPANPEDEQLLKELTQ